MRRDWDIIRAILLGVETVGPHGTLRPADLPEFDADTVSRHIELLIEAGLAKGRTSGTIGAQATSVATGLTWQGYELLGTVRPLGRWGAIKEKIRSSGLDLTLDAIVEIAKALMRAGTGGA